MNKVIVCGRSVSEWKVHKYKDDKSFITGALALNDVKDRTEFVNITAFGKTAEILHRYVKKGDMVLIEGSLHTSVSEKDGKKTYFTSVVAFNVNLLPNERRGSKKDELDVQF